MKINENSKYRQKRNNEYFKKSVMEGGSEEGAALVPFSTAFNNVWSKVCALETAKSESNNDLLTFFSAHKNNCDRIYGTNVYEYTLQKITKYSQSDKSCFDNYILEANYFFFQKYLYMNKLLSNQILKFALTFVKKCTCPKFMMIEKTIQSESPSVSSKRKLL